MMRKLIQTQCPVQFLSFVLAISLVGSSCNDNAYSSPKGYDFRKPVKSELGRDLNEISGMTYNDDDTTILAVSDSKRKVFELDLKMLKLRDYSEKMYTQSDFEDLVKLDTTVYVLISNGTIISMPLRVHDSSNTTAYPLPFSGKNDFETLYHDQALNALIVLCKSCESDKGKQMRSAYRFDLLTKQFDSSAFYTISTKDVKGIMKNDDADFSPSAAAIHPVDKRLYILSSAGNLLVIADTRGKVLEGYNLNPDQYPQAEGITFSPNGTLYISNEGKYGKPTLLMFPYLGKQDAPKKSK
ncbi:MAG TPA: SdiA-regulated domain-containing protein [Chitinophagaceae bacterium]|jgi:hypothetical protein|nr:SdiA-regulated domain-containing protein [Chitinophagaceae bacterium]